MERQHHKRTSVSMREGPPIESRTGAAVHDVLKECFTCCNSESCTHHRKSLSDRTLTSANWSNMAAAESMRFARESMVTVEPRHSKEGQDGDTFSFGNMDDDDDEIDDYQRCIRCLKSDYKTFAASNFDRLVRENETRAILEVWPHLERELIKTAKAASGSSVSDESESFAETFHEPASRKFPIAVVELYKKENDDSARKLLQLIFYLIPSKNKDISTYWTECLEKLVDSCNSANVQKDIYPKIVELTGSGGVSIPPNGRCGACRLLRKLAKRFNSEVIERKVFTMMESLVKDPDADVRAAAALALPEMIHRIQKKDEALKLINMMKDDPDPKVRAALTTTIVKSVALLNPREEKNKEYLQNVMQIIKVLVKEAYIHGNIDVLVAFSEYMGHVCDSFTAAGILKPRDILWYLDAYLQLCKYDSKMEFEDNIEAEKEMPPGFANFRANMEFSRRHSIVEALISTKADAMLDRVQAQSTENSNKIIAALRANAGSRKMSIPYGGGITPSACLKRQYGPDLEKAFECRKNAAKQFYEFMMFANPIVGFRHGLHPLVTDLMHDTRSEVRGAMAEQLLPIMEYLGAEAGVLHGELVYCLSDDDIDVIQALIPSISKILKCLTTAKILSPDKITPKLVEIGGAILYCEERLNQTTYYKVHQAMLEQFTVLPFCLPGDYVFSNFVPSLFHRLRHMRVLPCRMAAANAIVIFLRHCRRSTQREEIRRRIRMGFAQGRSVHDRMLFLYMAKKIMEKFSKKYFREHFFEDVVLLANDPIGNVRRKVIELMPELKDLLEDPNMSKKLDETFKNARKSEVDRDVKAKMDEVAGNFQPKKVDPKKPREKSGDRSPATKKSPNDPEDQVKQMEEELIENMEKGNDEEEHESFKERRKSFYGTTKKLHEPSESKPGPASGGGATTGGDSEPKPV